MIRNEVGKSIIKDMMLTSMYNYRVKVKNIFKTLDLYKYMCLDDNITKEAMETLLLFIVCIMSKNGIDSAICLRYSDFTLSDHIWMISRLYQDCCDANFIKHKDKALEDKLKEYSSATENNNHEFILKTSVLEEIIYYYDYYNGTMEVMNFVRDKLQSIKNDCSISLKIECDDLVDFMTLDEYSDNDVVIKLYDIIHNLIYYWSLDSGYGFNSSEEQYNKTNIMITYVAFKEYITSELKREMPTKTQTVLSLLDRKLVLGECKSFVWLNSDEINLISCNVIDIVYEVVRRNSIE